MDNFGVSLHRVITNITKKFQISKNSVITIIEKILTKITKKKLGGFLDIVVKININTLTYKTYRLWVVVDDTCLKYPLTEITHSAAKLNNTYIKVGEKVAEVISSIPFDNFVLKNIKNVIHKKLKEADKYTKLENYVKKINSVVVGHIEKVTLVGFILRLDDNITGFLPKIELLPGEIFNLNDKIKVCLVSVNAVGKGPKLLFSRIRNSLLLNIFCTEIPEICDGSVSVKALARMPGIRSKIAVTSYFSNIDPVGACLGIHTSRLQSISKELNNENIDVILWSDNFVDFIVNIFNPIPIITMFVNKCSRVVEIVVQKENLSKFIGKNGQNINLASVLIDYEINVVNFFEKVNFFDVVCSMQKDVLKLLKVFRENLELSDTTLLQFILSGYKTCEEISFIPDKELLEVFGLSKLELRRLNSNKKYVTK